MVNNQEDLPLALFAHADRIEADIGSNEWRLTTQREQGRSHALVLSYGTGFTQLAQGLVKLKAPCLLWLPPGVGQSVRNHEFWTRASFAFFEAFEACIEPLLDPFAKIVHEVVTINVSINTTQYNSTVRCNLDYMQVFHP